MGNLLDKNNSEKIRTITGLGVLTAVVIVLQLFGSTIHFGPFSISLVNVPLTLGAILYGVAGGLWLGFVFGVVVLISGDAALFLVVTIIGTIITVIVKGMAAGAGAGLVYRLLSDKNKTLAEAAAAVTCPVINTGVFLICCLIFFMDTMNAWATAAGIANVGTYMIVGLVGSNFLAELCVSAILTPAISRLLRTLRKNG